MEKAMAPHSSTLAWKIPWMEKSGGLQPMGSLRVGHHWATSLPFSYYMGFPCGSAGKESTRNAGDLGSIPGFGRSPGEGKGSPLQYSALDCIVHGVAKSWIQLSDFHFTLCVGGSREKYAVWFMIKQKRSLSQNRIIHNTEKHFPFLKMFNFMAMFAQVQT